MTAPSNANTSGLEVVAWRWPSAFCSGTKACSTKKPKALSRDVELEPLVTAASAQARIDEERALFKSLRVRKNFYKENMLAAEDRATAAEARADRLSERLRADPTPEQLEPFARKWCIDNGIDPDAPKAPHGEWPEWYDACGPFAAMWRDIARAALQQETQP